MAVQYHIRCVCENYTVSLSSGIDIECDSCLNKISTANEDFFVYIPIEQQLRQVIDENFDEIVLYPPTADENFMTDIHDGIQFKKASENFKDLKVLSMVVCTDGAQVFKSTQKSLWAIQLYLNFLKPSKRYIAKNVMVVGLHYAKKKPNMQKFFYPLLSELQQIHESGGFTVEKKGYSHHFMPIITHCCCDLPAKADVQGTTTHNGYYACGFCLHPGKPIKKDAKSKAVVRYTNRNKTEVLRTHEQMLKTYEKITSTPIDGIKQVSCLVASNHFDLVYGFCIDYMHAVLLGVVKKQLNLWIDSVYHDKPFYIKPSLQPILDKRIKNIKPTTEIARKPRSISEKANFKANELRNFLLYYLPCCLNGLLKKRYIDHFQLLSASIYMLLEERIAKQNIDIAERKLVQYADEYEKLYGEDNVTLNLHLLRHIATSVRNLGPLWSQSAFAMEDNNGTLIKITAKNKILQSIAFRSTMRSINHDNDLKISVGGPKKCILNPDQLNALCDYDFKKQKPVIYEFMVLNGIKYTSKKSKKIATVDYYLKLKNEKFGAVEFYFVHKLVVYGLMNEYKIIDRKDHMNAVEPTSQYIIFNFKEVEKKLIYMNIYMNMKNCEFITSIPNRYEKS